MPINNHFAHQIYSAGPPKAPYEILPFDPLPNLDSDEYWNRMHTVGQVLRRANVGAIVLVHGTFVGNDPWGLAAMFFGHKRASYEKWCQRQKNLADRVVKDRGNFPPQYISVLADRLGTSGELSVSRFLLSGINNHAGRAYAAVNLHRYLCNLDVPRGKRILICGHSHGGNVLALLTNLLAAELGGVEAFLDAVGEYAQTFDAEWQLAAKQVLEAPKLTSRHPLDLVTFGMPIRYGFETTGYAQLLHFVNHRPGKLRAPYRVAGPMTLAGMFSAAHGDYIHELGIAGSNFSTPISRPLWRCDRRLARQLAKGLSWRKITRRMARGMRVTEEGLTLLVDYKQPGGQWWRSGLGHAEYTHVERMLFHFEHLARYFYSRTDFPMK